MGCVPHPLPRIESEGLAMLYRVTFQRPCEMAGVVGFVPQPCDGVYSGGLTDLVERAALIPYRELASVLDAYTSMGYELGGVYRQRVADQVDVRNLAWADNR